MNGSTYKKINLSEVPTDTEGNSLVDLFVVLPTSNRYVRFIASGQPLSNDRTSLVDSHVVKDFFVKTASLEVALALQGQSTQPDLIKVPQQLTPATDHVFIIKGDALAENQRISGLPPNLQSDIVGKQAQLKIQQLLKTIVNSDEQDPTVLLGILEQEANTILETIAPDTKDLKQTLIMGLKHLMLMNDVSAIVSLAVFIALSQGYDSKKSFRDLTLACLIMDTSLMEYSEAQILQFYIDPSTLPSDVQDKMRRHPARSFELAQLKLKSISDSAMQLILNHHELYNGKGYPRGVRTEALFPMVKVLALAVDIFETLKRNEALKKVVTLEKVIVQFLEPGVESHMRRHSRKIVDNMIRYMELNPKLIEIVDKDEEA